MANALKAHETSKRKFLMLGHTGGGKTTQFLTLPGRKFAYLFDPNAVLSLQGFDVEYEEFLPDRLNMSVKSLAKDKGDKTTNFKNDLYVEWERDFNEKMDSGFFNDYDVIMLDSATTLLDIIMDRTLTINGRPGSWPQQDDYGPQMMVFTNIVRTLTSLDKIVYLTGHLETKQDKLTQRIMREVMMTGRLKTKIPLLFSDIYVCDAVNDGNGKINYTLQTKSDRMTSGIRSSIKGLEGFEDVTLDFTKPLEDQGLGGILKWEREQHDAK